MKTGIIVIAVTGIMCFFAGYLANIYQSPDKLQDVAEAVMLAEKLQKAEKQLEECRQQCDQCGDWVELQNHTYRWAVCDEDYEGVVEELKNLLEKVKAKAVKNEL